MATRRRKAAPKVLPDTTTVYKEFAYKDVEHEGDRVRPANRTITASYTNGELRHVQAVTPDRGYPGILAGSDENLKQLIKILQSL